MRLRVGARGSDLSLAQTRWLIDRLREAHAGLDVELVVIETHGDRDQTTALDMLWPPGGFVKEIERALLGGEIDLAVHSLKDVPTEPVEGLAIAAIPRREDARDVLVTCKAVSVEALPEGFTVGTCSARRSHQIMRLAPHARTEGIRGNVPTRIRKLKEGAYDGIILAAAGLARLGIHPEHALSLPLDGFLPAPGQGALAAQTRVEGEARVLATAIDDESTRVAVAAERAFLRACGGGCHAALGAIGTVMGQRLQLRGELFVDGEALSATVEGPAAEAEELGEQLADAIKR